MRPKRRIGRPLLPGAKRRGKLIKMRVTLAEWRQIRHLARERDKTVTELLRDALGLGE